MKTAANGSAVASSDVVQAPQVRGNFHARPLFEHALGDWGVMVAGTAGEERGYRRVEGFERQRFTLSLTLQPPRWFSKSGGAG